MSTTETSSISPAFESRSSLAGLVAERAAEKPGAIAVEDGEQQLTYAELDAAAANVAAGLLAAGVEDQDVVGVCLPRSWQAVCAFVGVVRAGAAYVPVVPTHPPDRQRALLELAGARTVLTGAGHDGGLPSGLRMLDAEKLAGSGSATAMPCAPGGDRLAYVLFTSGSTGVPKGVEITHANIAQVLASGSDLVPLPGDTVLGVAPIEFDISVLEMWGALAAGGRLVLLAPGRPDPRAVGRLIAEKRVTYAFFAAGLFEQVVRASLPDLAGMRLIAAGGDVMSPAAAQAILAAHPRVRVINGYGPTETSIIASSFEVTGVDGSPLPIGRPLPGYEFHVLDERRRPVAEGEAGELWIGGPGVARGYRGDRERTADRFCPSPFAPGTTTRMYGSGDIVRQREDGEFQFLGRVDHQVKIAGHRVEPGEVEQALGGHPAVRHAAVVAREDVAGHKRLVAFASLKEGSRAGDRELLDHLAERLPTYMLPASVEILTELPLTARGKVDRAALPSPARTRGGGDPAAGTALIVAKTMAELAGLDEVGPDEDFFALGADSLLAIQLIGRLRDRFGSGLDVGAIFESRTARSLAARIDAGEGTGPRRRPLVAAPSSGHAPASFAQRRAWLFERMNPDSLAFQFACILHLEGDLDEDALAAALGDLIRRHEILRTGLVEQAGEPVQVVHEDVALPLEIVDLPGESGVEWARLVRDRVRTRIELARAPLVRWTLVRRGNRRWSLIDVEHHAVHDGWSFMVMLSELAELYSARVEARASNLPPPRLQFGDFARWERSSIEPELELAQLEHWRQALDPDPALLELPLDRPRPRRESFVGGSVRRALDPDLAAAVRQLARGEGATSFMACLAAFATLLGRYAECDDVQVGSGLANRRDPAAERLIGMTVATVALRIDLSGDPTVRELLQRARGTVLAAMANSDVPFEQVVETLAPSRQSSRSPLVQTLFSFDDAPATPQHWSGLDVKVVQTVPNGTAKADLNVIGVDHGDRRPFFIWEHSDLFTDATVDRLAGQHLQLLEQFTARPGARLSELRLTDDAEQRQLRGWRANGGTYDRQATVHGLIAGQAERDPDAVAVVDRSARLTYGDLLTRAQAMAGSLRAAGVAPGDRVGVLLPRSLDSVVSHLSVLIAGAAYVPLDPQHPAARIARSLADAEAEVVLTDAALGADLPADLAALEVTAALAGEPLEANGGDAEDLAYLMYTSGSTGEPKGVEVTHRNVVRLVDDPDYVELGSGMVMLHAASTAFDATTLEIWGPLTNGGTVAILAEHPSPDAIDAAIEAHGVTTLWLTAGLFHELVDRRPECLGQVRHLLAGGDVLSPSHVARALERLPADGRLTNGYGPTETTTFALTHELRPGDAIDGPIPLGRPIQGTSCDVLDAAGRPAPVGMAGELWIGGDGVARGYRGDPELSAERFRPDPERPGGRRYRSGDRVRRRPDGALEFLGRADRQVKVRGVRVEPAEVEQVLRGHPKVLDAAVVPFERAPGDLALAAYVVGADDATAPDSGALREHATARLPAAMVPAAWLELEQLPLTTNGKLDRDRLPTPGHEHLVRSKGGEPSNDAERLVVAAFEKVLKTRPLGVEDDFFALGGHSLLALALFAELERTARRRLPLATIFEASTPRSLAACLGSDAPASNWENLIALKPQGSRPPLFVVSAGDGNLVGFAPLARHLSAEQPLYGLQPSGLDGRRPLDRGIEAMASRYLEKLREVQPHGPYLLAGRCNGATVAYEMAQRLRAEGEEVPLLVALDSDPPPAGPEELAPGIPYEAMMETAWLRARACGEEVPDVDAPGGPTAVATWLRMPIAPAISRYLHEAWHWRGDLREAWTDPLGADADALSQWAWNHGLDEMGLNPALLQPVIANGCRIPSGHSWNWALAAAWKELGHESADPLSSDGWRALRKRLLEPAGADATVNRYLYAAWTRPDLQVGFPEPLGDSAEALREWAWEVGIKQGLVPELLPPPPAPLSRRSRNELRLRSLQRRGGQTRAHASIQARRLAAEGRARAIETVERRLDRPLPGARWRIERRVLAAARQARAGYRAQPWPGKITLVTSTEFADKPPYVAWALRATDGVDLRPLPLGHVEMLREPGAELLARCLEECIASALADIER